MATLTLRPIPARWLMGAALLLYCVASAFSVYTLQLKRDALGFHTRDYNYFIEQAARLADPGLTNRYATNIEGHNFAGLQGIEGVRSIYQAIHNEYFRYTYVALYFLFRDPLPVYIWFCLIYYLPVLYAAWIARKAPGPLQAWMVLFILLYLCYPGSAATTSGDLRTRLLFASAWALAVLAVFMERPFLERLVFLAFLPFIREEGILLGAILTALNLIRPAKQPGRLVQTAAFLAILGAALAAFVAFMAWGGYTRVDVIYNPINRILQSRLGGWLGLAGVGLAGLVYRLRKEPRRLEALLLGGVYSLVLILTGLQFASEFSLWYADRLAQGPVQAWDIYSFTLTGYDCWLFYSAAILLFVLGGMRLGPRLRKPLLASGGVFVLLMLATTAITLPPQLANWGENAIQAGLVWEFKSGHDPYQTRLLVDFSTYQAFYNFEHVMVYNRLPVWMVYPNLMERFYPQNREMAARMIAKGIDYAVIARASQENVRELAHMAGRQLVEIAANREYLVFQLAPLP